MAGHTTKPYKNTFSGSVGAGMGSLFNPGGRKYYILEHKVSSRYHKAGESQEIIVDNIEIGRDAHCQVRFDESFKTVSRHHAAIVRDGDNWKLVQISKTNRTLLNGHPVQTEWYLQNGDEIQLSINGPKLGFIIPTGKKSTVGSIGLTRRLSLFRQQALRPYKTAITVLSCVLVLAVGGLVTWNYMLREDLVKQNELLARQIELNKDNKAKADSLAQELIANNKKMEGYEERIQELHKQVASAWETARKAQEEAKKAITPSTPTAQIESLYSNIYFIRTFVNNVHNEDGDPIAYIGTGFLLNDGRFVTARHVVDVWDQLDLNSEGYIIEGTKTGLNRIAHNEAPLDITLIATSSSGDKMTFNYTSENMPFTVGEENIQRKTYQDENGQIWNIHVSFFYDDTDWAYIKTSKTGGLAFDKASSVNLPAKTPLDILGFPHGRGAENPNKPSPIYTESTVARSNLDTDGTIMLSNEDTQGGNSGGPVFLLKDGKYYVIGILSGATDGKDRVVPIAAIH